jgi:hypothetical protein
MIVPPIESETMLTVFAKADDFRSHNVMVDLATRAPRKLSASQPTNVGLQNGLLSPSQPINNGLQNGYGIRHGHRVIHSTTVGYIAPKFEGKKVQMTEG